MCTQVQLYTLRLSNLLLISFIQLTLTRNNISTNSCNELERTLSNSLLSLLNSFSSHPPFKTIQNESQVPSVQLFGNILEYMVALERLVASASVILAARQRSSRVRRGKLIAVSFGVGCHTDIPLSYFSH